MAKSRNPQIEFDKLQMYFGDPYVIDIEGIPGVVTIYQPTIGDIVRMGEKKFYSTLSIFTTNTTSYRAMLWDIGIDWNVISDFELFQILYKGADPDVVALIFKDIDLRNFEVYQKRLSEDSEEVTNILYDKENDIEINEVVYWHISQYLRNVFNIFPEEKLTKDATMKSWYIDKDKREAENNKRKEAQGDIPDTSILSIISACVNHPGFKYSSKQLRDIGVCEFYDSVRRLQVYESSTALLKGMYSGFVSGKDIPADATNFMRNT